MAVQVAMYPLVAQGLALRYGFVAKLEPDFAILRAVGMVVFLFLFLALEVVYTVKLVKRTERLFSTSTGDCTVYVGDNLWSTVINTFLLLWTYWPLFSVVRGHRGLQQTHAASTQAQTLSQNTGSTLLRSTRLNTLLRSTRINTLLGFFSRMLHARIFYLMSISAWFYGYAFVFWFQPDPELSAWGFGQVSAMAALAILIFEGYRLLKSTQVPNMLAEL